MADPQKREQLREAIVKRNLSVRQAEALANRLNRDEAPRAGKKDHADAHLRSLADSLAERLGSKVTVKPMGKTRGRIEIYYASLDDLDRLIESLVGAQAT